MKNIFKKLLFFLTIVLSYYLFSFFVSKFEIENSSEEYMNKCNQQKIKCGCFYFVKDSFGLDSLVITKKNF